MAIAQTPTTASHDARSRDTGAIVAEMADQPGAGAAGAAEGELAIARLRAMASDVRGCAILRADGSLLACTGEPETWEAVASALLAAADEAIGEPATHAHVGTDDGEVFALRQGDFAIVAAAERFTLASLILCDLRAALRELERGLALASPAAA